MGLAISDSSDIGKVFVYTYMRAHTRAHTWTYIYIISMNEKKIFKKE